MNLVVQRGFSPAIYDRMVAAISECHATDECAEITNKAAALAAYCKQAKDDSAMRKVNEIKLRACRRKETEVEEAA